MTETVAAGRERVAPSVRALDRVVDGLLPEVSMVRARQLRMVVGMWDLALERWPAGQEGPPRSVRGLFEDRVLQVFWELAVAGELRTRGEDGPLPVATLRVVRDCLGILGDRVAPGGVWLPVVGQQEAKSVVPRGQLGVLYRRLVDMASDAPVERGRIRLRVEHRARLLAMVAVVLDTGCRSVELEGMRVGDLSDGAGSVVVRRRVQNGAHLAAVGEVCRLRDGTGVAVRRWLRVREGLVAHLQGGVPDALWVSVHPAPTQPTLGFPLRARGIQRSYASGARALNDLMAGRRGWSPLPTTLEQLRRAVPVPEPVVGGG